MKNKRKKAAAVSLGGEAAAQRTTSRGCCIYSIATFREKSMMPYKTVDIINKPRRVLR